MSVIMWITGQIIEKYICIVRYTAMEDQTWTDLIKNIHFVFPLPYKCILVQKCLNFFSLYTNCFYIQNLFYFNLCVFAILCKWGSCHFWSNSSTIGRQTERMIYAQSYCACHCFWPFQGNALFDRKLSPTRDVSDDYGRIKARCYGSWNSYMKW